MIIDNDDINDVKFKRENTEVEQSKWLEKGLERFDYLCTSYGIDYAKIPSPAPYIPKKIAELCSLIEWCSANLGSDYLAIRDDYSIDVFKTKKTEYEDELASLLSKFTPKNCGIELSQEELESESENTNSFRWFRG